MTLFESSCLLSSCIIHQSKELPLEYVSELQGLEDGGKAAGCKECGKYSTRGIVLANFPSDLQDLVYIFLRCVRSVLCFGVARRDGVSSGVGVGGGEKKLEEEK